jgi:hypothetical protein
MTDPNPYRSPADAGGCPPNRDRVRVIVLAVVLLDVALSACKIVWNLPGLLRSPDSSAVMIGIALVLWTAWIVAELFAARWIWRGHPAGRWILVVSFGLKGIGHLGSLWPLLLHAPYLILAWPWLNFAVQAVCYSVVTVWLLLLPRFEKRTAGDRGILGHFDGDQSAKGSFTEPN